MSGYPVASLPMYDWREVQNAHDELWQLLLQALQKKGISAPASLTRTRPYSPIWYDKNLVISQTCGYPLATELRGKVTYLATPHYAVDGCDGPYYASAFIVRTDEPAWRLETMRGRKFGYNSLESLSGYRVICAETGDPAVFFGSTLETGSHRRSAQNVVEGRIDVAAIDAVCLHLLKQFEPEVCAGLKVLQWSPLRPGLPFITALDRSQDEILALQSALLDVCGGSLPQGIASVLGLAGASVLDPIAYAPLADL